MGEPDDESGDAWTTEEGGFDDDPTVQRAVDATAERIRNDGGMTRDGERTAETETGSAYSTGNVQDLVQQLLNQGVSAGTVAAASGGGGRGGGTTTQLPQPPLPPSNATTPQAQGPAYTAAIPTSSENLMTQQQTMGALVPLFAQWMHVSQQQQQQQQQQHQQQLYGPIMIQLLQQILASSNQAPFAQVNANAISTAFLQSYMYAQMQQQQQQQQSGGMINPTFISTAPTAPVILPWSAPGVYPGVAGFNTVIPGGVQPAAVAATVTTTTTVPGNTSQRSDEAPAPKKRRRYNMEAFPQKLHRLITEAAANDNDSIVRFTEDGTMFRILNSDEFEKLLPGYFRHNSMASFKRLLHMYDFKRVQGTWVSRRQCCHSFLAIMKKGDRLVSLLY